MKEGEGGGRVGPDSIPSLRSNFPLGGLTRRLSEAYPDGWAGMEMVEHPRKRIDHHGVK